MAKFARVTFGESDPARFEEGIANLNQTVIPQARELPGFQGGYWLADRATGKILAVVVYDSEEHIRRPMRSPLSCGNKRAASAGCASPAWRPTR